MTKSQSNISKGFFIVCILALIISCNNKNAIKRVRTGDFDMEGNFINDSIPDGDVNYYIAGTDILSGRRQFKDGVENGQSCNYHGKVIVQKSNIVNGAEHGFTELFDSTTGQIRQRKYYFYGKRLGPVYGYDDQGKDSIFQFLNFENQLLFDSRLDSSGKMIYDNFEALVQPSVAPVWINNAEKLRVFFYMISPPRLSVEYKIAYYDAVDEQLDSFTPKSSSGIFWEGVIDPATKNRIPAIVLNLFDSTSNKSQRFVTYLLERNADLDKAAHD